MLGAGVGTYLGAKGGYAVGSSAGRAIDQKLHDWTHAQKQADKLNDGDQSRCGGNCMAADKAPGKPSEKDGYKPPKRWDGNKVASSGGYGWPDQDGNVWVPTGPDGSPAAHGGEHWDVQSPGGGYTNVYPGGIVRGGKSTLAVVLMDANMKNLMIVDGCQDYGFDIHRVSDDDFSQLMQGSSGRVAFIEDIYRRQDYDALFPAFQRMWYGRVRNELVGGVDGLLFYESIGRKAAYDDHSINCESALYCDNPISITSMKHIILFDVEPFRKICPYAISDAVFDILFPGSQMNVAFAEDFMGGHITSVSALMEELKGVALKMEDIKSISGIIYVGYPGWVSKYPLRSDAEMARHYPLSDQF